MGHSPELTERLDALVASMKDADTGELLALAALLAEASDNATEARGTEERIFKALGPVIGAVLTERVRVDALPSAERPVAATRMPGPVRQLVHGRGVVGLARLERATRRERDRVGSLVVVGTVPAVADDRARAGDERLSGRVRGSGRRPSLQTRTRAHGRCRTRDRSK